MIEFFSLIYAEQISNLKVQLSTKQIFLCPFPFSLYLFPVSCGHRKLIVNGRGSKFLQERKKERVQSSLNEIKFELYIVAFSKLCSQEQHNMLVFVTIIIWQKFMLEFYKKISGNKQNTYYKNIRDKNDLTLCLCCVSTFQSRVGEF